MDISDSDDRDMMAFGEGPKAAVTNMTVPERIGKLSYCAHFFPIHSLIQDTIQYGTR